MRRIGGFEIGGVLGRGGIGVVYERHPLGTGQKVAAKLDEEDFTLSQSEETVGSAAIGVVAG